MYLDLPLLSSIIDKKDTDYLLRPSATIILSELIKSLKVKSISLPAFLCEEILLSIYQLNIKINFYELDSSYSPVLKKDHLNSECLFICDYFGYPIKLSTYLKSFLLDSNKPLIIDRCHSLFAGNKSNCKHWFFTRENVFMVYSLRKFLPLINGALIIKKKKDKIIVNNINKFISNKSRIKSYFKSFIKISLNNNKIGSNLLVKHRLNKINKRDLNQINGFDIKIPDLKNKKRIELGYYFNSLDKRSLSYLKQDKLKILGKLREHEIKKISNELENLIKNTEYELNICNFNYGAKYGVSISLRGITSKNKIENDIIIPFLKINKKVEIFLWPYNTCKAYQIEKIPLNSIILFTPRI